MGKRGEGIDTSSFYSSGYALDRSKVKVWELCAEEGLLPLDTHGKSEKRSSRRISVRSKNDAS
jgi:hypothetical protein